MPAQSGSDPLPLLVGRPNLGNRDCFQRHLEGIFDRRWFTNNGQVVRELEARLCGYLGVRHCIPVCNATVGLQVACQAMDLAGEVIVPAYTFVATPHSLQWEGIKPVFADIDPSTHLLDPRSVRERITPRTSAILGVHLWGRACLPEQLGQIADEHGLQLYFDAAHAFGCAHAGRMIGSFGRCEVFSFHATKFFNTFEGGAITTNDDQLAERIRLMINFGFVGMDTVVHLGTNGKMSEIHAAMGLACFESLDEIVAANRRNLDQYRRELNGLRGVQLHDYDDLERCNFQYVVVEIDPTAAGKDRDELMARLHAERIIARRYFHPGCHRMEPYATLYPDQADSLPITDRVCSRVLVLPTGTAVSPTEISWVCDIVRQAIG